MHKEFKSTENTRSDSALPMIYCLALSCYENLMKVSPLSSDILVSFKDPLVLWNENWLAVTIEIFGLALLYQVYKYTKKRDAESAYLILTAMVSTICFEVLPFGRPGYELWWFHPGLINVLKHRVPSYIICSFTLAHYAADRMTNQSNLPRLTRGFVTAIIGLLVLTPFLWMASRLLLLTYHFDDPVFKDKLFGIPYIQLLVLFLLFFHSSHLYQENTEELQPHQRNSYNYVLCALQSGVVASIYAIVEQYVLYILVTLTLSLNTGYCLLAAGTILALLAKGEIEQLQFESTSSTGMFQPLKRRVFWAVVAGFVFLSTMPLWLNFENLQSTGERLELGSCHTMQLISNTNPLEVTRRRYLCPEDTKRMVFDFHCVAEDVSLAAQEAKKNYTICGKKMTNNIRTGQMLFAYSSLCLFMFYNFMRVSFKFKIERKFLEVSKKVE